MRRSLFGSQVLVACVLAGSSLGCAESVTPPTRPEHASEPPHEGADDVDDVEAIEVAQPPQLVVAPPSPSPRLSRVVTLGQGTSEPIYVTPDARKAAGPSVVVNNNVVVNSAPSGTGYYGYGGGYGYGGYGGYGYGGGYASAGSRDGRGAMRSAWAPSGWEGPQRTAAPGHTPGVGGNWSPPPSSGPRPMR